MYKIILVLILGGLLTACSGYSVVSVRAAVDVPAEINLIPYRKVKIVAKEGKYAKDVVEELEAKLKDSFEITDGDDGAQIYVTCKERFNADKVEEKNSVKTTRINIHKDREDETVAYKNEFVHADVEKTKRFIRYNELELDVKFDIFADGKELAVRTFNPKNVVEKENVGSPPPPIDPDTEFIKTLYYVVYSFSNSIVPKKSYEDVRIQKVKHPRFNEGLKYAKRGNWQEATDVFNEMRLENNSDQTIHAKNMYNYAVGLQYSANKAADPMQRLQESFDMLEKAYQISQEDLYKSQQESCANEIRRLKRLRKRK